MRALLPQLGSKKISAADLPEVQIGWLEYSEAIYELSTTIPHQLWPRNRAGAAIGTQRGGRAA